MATPPAAKPVMLYDAGCPFCRRWVARWRRVTGDRVSYLPSAEGAARFPEIPASWLAGAVQYVALDGRVFSGADAAVRSLALRPGWRWVLGCYVRVPGAARAARVAYRWVARRRGRL